MSIPAETLALTGVRLNTGLGRALRDDLKLAIGG